MGNIPKEPPVALEVENVGWVLNEEWVGWYILHKYKKVSGQPVNVQVILDEAERLIPAFIGKEGQVVATIARNGTGKLTIAPAGE